jgi:hypothetical protein
MEELKAVINGYSNGNNKKKGKGDRKIKSRRMGNI